MQIANYFFTTGKQQVINNQCCPCAHTTIEIGTSSTTEWSLQVPSYLMTGNMTPKPEVPLEVFGGTMIFSPSNKTYASKYHPLEVFYLPTEMDEDEDEKFL